MKEITGDIWEVRKTTGSWVCVTTNAIVNSSGLAVMGAGVALQSAEKFKHIPKMLGQKLSKHGNRVYAFMDDQIFTFPTKQNWRSESELDLIASSAMQLRELLDAISSTSLNGKILLPRVGCGNGNLSWDKQVKPVVSAILDDRFLVVSL